MTKVKVSNTGRFAQELRKIAQRIHDIGCDRCFHRDENSPVCQMIISQPERWNTCNYYCERKENI